MSLPRPPALHLRRASSGSRRSTGVVVGLALLLLWALPILGRAASEARITGLAAGVEGSSLKTDFRLVDGFGPEILERVQSGLPTSFLYRVELRRKRRMWWDRTLAVTELRVVAMYNAVTREYLINFEQDGKLAASRLVRDSADLERTMTVLEGVTVSPLAALPDEGRFELRVRAELGSRTLLSFIPIDIQTDWVELFVRPTSEP